MAEGIQRMQRASKHCKDWGMELQICGEREKLLQAARGCFMIPLLAEKEPAKVSMVCMGGSSKKVTMPGSSSEQNLLQGDMVWVSC